VNEQEKTVSVENFTDDLLFRAFGVNEHPSWKDYEDFLEERCFPRTRQNLKFYLKQLGLTEYDPFAICRVTNGRMHGDSMWMEITEGISKEKVCEMEEERA
jgi:putative transcriptional regulator